MLIRYRNHIINTDKIAEIRLNEEAKSLVIASSLDSRVPDLEWKFGGDKKLEAKCRALWAWYVSKSENIEPATPPAKTMEADIKQVMNQNDSV